MTLRLLLLVLGVVAFGYQGLLSWNLISDEFGEGPVLRQPFRMPGGSDVVARVQPEAAEAGLKVGDRLLAVAGKPYRGWHDLDRAYAALQPGGTLAVRWQGEAGEREGAIKVAFEPRQPVSTGLAVIVVSGMVTPLLCLVTGFGVTAIRPRDRNAWTVLLMLWTFAMLSAVGDSPAVLLPAWMGGFIAVYPVVISSWWGAAMALFAWYFPAPVPADRKWPWIKWVFVGVTLAHTLVAGVMAYRNAEDLGFASELASIYGRRVNWSFWLSSIGVASFFTVMGFRNGTEKNPDARRRLKVLRWGMYVALLPVFVTIVVGQILNRNPFASATAFPVWVTAPVLALMFLFPATMAYIIVVEKALDVRVVVRQGLQYALARRGLVVLQVLIMLAAIWLAGDVILDPAASRPRRLQALALAMGAVAWSRVALDKLRVWIDRRFFREAVDAERVLTELGESVSSYVEAKPLLKRVADVVRETLHVESVSMMLAGSSGLELAYATGAADGEELKVPLKGKTSTLGAMVLGPKQNEEPYSPSDKRLLESVAGQTALALEHSQLTQAMAAEVAKRERINRELEIAREVQERLFPQVRPEVAGIVYAGKCRPALSVGGDYYDFLELPGVGVGLAIGDVSGKGVASALLMASLQACLRGQVLGGEKDLAKVMSNINQMIFDVSPVNKYATFFYGEYQAETRTLKYVNGGHNPPVVLRGEQVLSLQDGGPVVGLFRPARYVSGEVVLEPGDVLIGFTDGVSEAMNPQDEEWGEESLVAVAQAARASSPEVIIAALMAGADAFAAGAPQHDDMTLIVLKVV